MTAIIAPIALTISALIAVSCAQTALRYVPNAANAKTAPIAAPTVICARIAVPSCRSITDATTEFALKVTNGRATTAPRAIIASPMSLNLITTRMSTGECAAKDAQ